MTAGPLGQTIGGSAAGAGNLIAGNANVGIQLVGQQASGTTVNDVVQGNLIGLDAAGQIVDIGGGITGNGTGILVQNSPDDLIGGTTAADRNVISGNSGSGIQLFASSPPATRCWAITSERISPETPSPPARARRSPPQSVGVLINGASGDQIGREGAGNLLSRQFGWASRSRASSRTTASSSATAMSSPAT